jgi:hypothetical protein
MRKDISRCLWDGGPESRDIRSQSYFRTCLIFDSGSSGMKKKGQKRGEGYLSSPFQTAAVRGDRGAICPQEALRGKGRAMRCAHVTSYCRRAQFHTQLSRTTLGSLQNNAAGHRRGMCPPGGWGRDWVLLETVGNLNEDRRTEAGSAQQRRGRRGRWSRKYIVPPPQSTSPEHRPRCR